MYQIYLKIEEIKIAAIDKKHQDNLETSVQARIVTDNVKSRLSLEIQEYAALLSLKYEKLLNETITLTEEEL